jgi:hypothetical protein
MRLVVIDGAAAQVLVVALYTCRAARYSCSSYSGQQCQGRAGRTNHTALSATGVAAVQGTPPRMCPHSQCRWLLRRQAQSRRLHRMGCNV